MHAQCPWASVCVYTDTVCVSSLSGDWTRPTSCWILVRATSWALQTPASTSTSPKRRTLPSCGVTENPAGAPGTAPEASRKPSTTDSHVCLSTASSPAWVSHGLLIMWTHNGYGEYLKSFSLSAIWRTKQESLYLYVCVYITTWCHYTIELVRWWCHVVALIHCILFNIYYAGTSRVHRVKRCSTEGIRKSSVTERPHSLTSRDHQAFTATQS